MKIVILSINYPNPYDPLRSIFIRDQAEALSKAGNTVGVISVIPIPLKAILNKPKFIFGLQKTESNIIHLQSYLYPSIPKVNLQWVKMPIWKGKKLFKVFVKKFGKPDIVHVHSFEAGELAIWIKNKYNIPFVVTEHSSRFINNDHSKLMMKVAKRVFDNSAANIAVSEKFKKLLSSTFNVPFIYIPNIVDTENFKSEKTISNESFTFINVASLIELKNHEGLINAFIKAFGQNTNVSLKIIGDGELMQHLKNLVKRQKMENRISLLGYKSRDEIRIELSKSNIFVLSSKRETFGIVLIEALSIGLPLVATRCGGPESIITDPRIGVLCDTTVEAISFALIQAYANYKEFYQGDQLRKIAIDNYSQKEVVKKIHDVYSGIIKDNAIALASC